jgi:hypothetical protein
VSAVAGLPPTATAASVAAGYGRKGITAVASVTAVGSANPVATITARTKAFSRRTGAGLGKVVTVSLPGSTLQCTATRPGKSLPAGSLCVWADPRSIGQVWLASASPAGAASVAKQAHRTMVRS